MPSTLEQLGWSPFFGEQQAPRDDLVPWRVSIEYGASYRLLGPAGTILASSTGALIKNGPRPASGDWVGVAEERIHHVFDRRTALVRQAVGKRTAAQVIAANVDIVFIVSALNTEFSARRIERYVTLVWESGAKPVVVLNKSDLVDDPQPFVDQVSAVAISTPVAVVSGLADEVDVLRGYLAPGRTIAFVGSSGVGKSTLINRLLGSERLEVSEVRENDDKGRHTTTHRELVVLPDDQGILMDTPGMREVGLWDAAEGVSQTFADIEALGEQCRFADCRHETEPKCAVRSAIADGTLAAARLRSFRDLLAEQAFTETKRDAHARKQAGRRLQEKVTEAVSRKKLLRGRDD